MLSVDHYQFGLGNSQPVDGIAERLPGEAFALATSSVQPFKRTPDRPVVKAP
jgi:hypothetical protein